jgi:hypothetical protein
MLDIGSEEHHSYRHMDGQEPVLYSGQSRGLLSFGLANFEIVYAVWASWLEVESRASQNPTPRGSLGPV